MFLESALLNACSEILENRTEVLSAVNLGLKQSPCNAKSPGGPGPKFSAPLVMAVVNAAAHRLPPSVSQSMCWPLIAAKP
jgi:hypothetical protein